MRLNNLTSYLIVILQKADLVRPRSASIQSDISSSFQINTFICRGVLLLAMGEISLQPLSNSVKVLYFYGGGSLLCACPTFRSPWFPKRFNIIDRTPCHTGQLTDLGESVMRIGGNTGQLTDSGESVMRILITNLSELVEVNSTDWWCLIACAT